MGPGAARWRLLTVRCKLRCVTQAGWFRALCTCWLLVLHSPCCHHHCVRIPTTLVCGPTALCERMMHWHCKHCDRRGCNTTRRATTAHCVTRVRTAGTLTPRDTYTTLSTPSKRTDKHTQLPERHQKPAPQPPAQITADQVQSENAEQMKCRKPGKNTCIGRTVEWPAVQHTLLLAFKPCWLSPAPGWSQHRQSA